MATVEFTGHDLVVWFKENPSNGQEWQYRIRYECANETVIHYIRHNEEQSTDPDGMRVYKDVLTFEENRAAGLTRSPKVFMATQDAGGSWTPDAIEAEIDAYNPPPAPPVMFYENSFDGIRFDFDKPLDPDFAGIALWADTQNPVRKDRVTSKYIGPNTKFTLPLAEGTQYYVTYAAYDSFGFELLQETTRQIATLPKESFLLPYLKEELEAVKALEFKSSTALAKVAKSYSETAERSLQRAEERLRIYIDENGNLVAEKILALETKQGDFQSILTLEQQTRANEDEALSNQILQLGAKMGTDINAAIVEERTARVTAEEAFTKRLDQQASKIGQNEANFNDQITTLVNADGALSKRITDQAAQWNTDISGAILAASQTLNETIANREFALSQRIDKATATFGGFSSSLQSESQARADADSALGARIDKISVTDYSGQIATIEQKMSVQADQIGGLSGQYTLKLDVNGVISGFGLASQNGVSEFVISADRFLISHHAGRISPFYVVGGQVFIADAVIENARIRGAQIDDLSVNTLKIAGGAISAQQVATSADTYVAANGSADFFSTGYMTIGDGNGGSGVIDLSFTIDATQQYDSACLLELWLDTGSGFYLDRQIVHGITTDNGDTYSRVYGALKSVAYGSRVRVLGRIISGAYTPRSVARNMWVRNITLTLAGAKR
ncbi:DUF1983 domain-containing protein [uncultured Novosphingobium sp.]|uniref:phage tail tip fiber protein n=1 Tax=uncultured Novosphingobium sp. TaxID=292277 RepID=UPI0025827C4F|nr:DUF1983 domain-containing protein [uncultured Novosphingobium sp.]